jgi:hypothetical protein
MAMDVSVKEMAQHFGKNEETIKRWIRSGKFPGAHKNSDKEGWKIPLKDLVSLANPLLLQSLDAAKPTNSNEHEWVKLAYEAVLLSSPSEEMVSILSFIGIKRTLEVLRMVRNKPNAEENPEPWIKQAITEGWSMEKGD